jgi:hypothetical protein
VSSRKFQKLRTGEERALDLLQAGADSHGAERAREELVQLHLAAALLVDGHHQKVQLFAGKIYGQLRTMVSACAGTCVAGLHDVLLRRLARGGGTSASVFWCISSNSL